MSVAPAIERPVLRVRDLEVRFSVKREGLFAKASQLHAVDGVSFDIAPGHTLGPVGESGSGKSTTALAAARLIPARGRHVWHLTSTDGPRQSHPRARGHVAVMYTGRIVEQASRVRLLSRPLHPCTKALLSSVPSADPARDSRAGRILTAGDPPSPIDPPSGCRFASRCPLAVERCRRETPLLSVHEPDHRVACHRAGEAIPA